MPKIAMVAALRREVQSLVKHWPRNEKENEGRKFSFFEKDDAVVVCGGIGEAAARRAAEAVIAIYSPEIVYSVGFAGALNSSLKVGDVVIPRQVIDARDGSRIDTREGEGVLVSYGAVADPAQKFRLTRAYGAEAVDMEAAAVARSTQAHGIRFAAVKAISDASDFAMPAMEKFISADGRFMIASFTLFVLLRPWTWPNMVRLSRNSARASKSLCDRLRRLGHGQLKREGAASHLS